MKTKMPLLPVEAPSSVIVPEILPVAVNFKSEALTFCAARTVTFVCTAFSEEESDEA